MAEIDLKAIFTDPKRRKLLLIAGGVGIAAGGYVLWKKGQDGTGQFNVTPGGLTEQTDPTSAPYEDTQAASGDAGAAGTDQSLLDQLLGLFQAQNDQLSASLAGGLESLYSNQQVLSDQLAGVASLGAGSAGGGEVYYAPADTGYYSPAAAAAYQPQAADFGAVAYDPAVGFSVPGDVGPAASTSLADALFGLKTSTPKAPVTSTLQSVLASGNSAFAGLVNQPVKVATYKAPSGGGSIGQTFAQPTPTAAPSWATSIKVSQPAPTYSSLVSTAKTLAVPTKGSTVGSVARKLSVPTKSTIGSVAGKLTVPVKGAGGSRVETSKKG